MYNTYSTSSCLRHRGQREIGEDVGKRRRRGQEGSEEMKGGMRDGEKRDGKEEEDEEGGRERASERYVGRNLK